MIVPELGEPTEIRSGVNYWIDDFWTNKQRTAHRIHEVPFRGCFKPALANYFIKNFSNLGDVVYDPFAGRGTVPVEASLCMRIPAYNDANPLTKVLTHPRLLHPPKTRVDDVISEIDLSNGEIMAKQVNDPLYEDLLAFYHPETLNQLYLLKSILNDHNGNVVYDWIRMVATTRLTGHSAGYFSTYTLPPNQCCTADTQRKINAKYNKEPTWKNVKELIRKKSNMMYKHPMPCVAPYVELTGDAADTPDIKDNSVQLTVTSPPFLDVVNYKLDNWLRCWFNDIDTRSVQITNSHRLDEWEYKMTDVFSELYRITRPDGYVAFEVGEVYNGKINLDESITKIVKESNFQLKGVMINSQEFTKTSNIWGIQNNSKGTNTNRIVIAKKVR